MPKVFIPPEVREAEASPFMRAPTRAYRTEQCCWPIGEPRTPSFRYCDAPTRGGRLPYCDAHYAVAARKGQKLDDAA